MKTNFTFSLSIAAIALAVSSLAHAQPLPPAIKSAVDSGLKFEKSFPAAGGLTGWVLSQGPNTNMILFTPPSGDVAIAGNMFDAKGGNLTKQYLEAHGPKPDYEKMWGELEKSAWAAEGPKTKDAASVIYAFEDANCGFCHLYWSALQPYIKAGLQVRWVPVAFLSPESMPKAAALLSAPDAARAMAERHANYGKKFVPATPVSPAMKEKIEANAKLMRQYGFTGTPATFYKDKKGVVRATNGMPRLSELPEITGLPEQPQTDPALARFR